MRPSGFADARVLVTGATGFVSANLTRRLLQEGANVHLLLRDQSDPWRLADVLDRVQIHRADLREATRLADVMSAVKPDLIYHCAAFGGYPGETDFDAIVDTNLRGTINLLQAVSRHSYRCVVHAGSSSEYGMKSAPMKEDDILEPITPYGVTKAAATLYCQMTARATAKPIVTARLFSPYGPYEESGRLIPSVIRACLLGEDPEVTEGRQVRDFVFIDDVVDCLLRLPDAGLRPGEILNVGSGRQTSVRDVVQRIVELTGTSARPRWGTAAPRPYETTTWVADLSKVRSLVGWQPMTDLDEGLRQTIAWFSEHLRLYATTR